MNRKVIAVGPPEKVAWPENTTDQGKIKENDISWEGFTENTTFHGVKYIFQNSELKFRRPIWLIVVVSCIIFFTWQVGIRTGDYFKYVSTMDVQVQYATSLEFPAVTLCNQNSFRISEAVKWDLYDVIDEVFKTSNISKINLDQFIDKIDDMDYKEFILAAAHQKSVFIDSCKWNDVECNVESDFKTVLTDIGVCYTFNAAENETSLQTTEAGEGSGLSLVINVEQYEYMRGPQNDAGIKIMLHPQDEKPMMKEQGFAAAPGTHTLVAMSRTESRSLEPPYGMCETNRPPITQCQAQCRSRAVVERCGCQAVYMELTQDNATYYCDFYGSVSCIRQALADLRRSALECLCTPPCVVVKYEPRLSYAKLSKFNVERMILDNPEEKILLQNAFGKARETTQRSMADIRDSDEALMTSFLNNSDALYLGVINATQDLQDPSVIARTQNTLNIFATDFTSADDNLIRDEVGVTHNQVVSYFESSILTIGRTYSELREDLLGWNGSHYTFLELINDCETMVSKLEKNASTIPALNSSDALIEQFGSMDCYERISGKANYAVTILNIFNTYVDEFTRIDAARYRHIIDGVFNDTMKSAVDIEEHRLCIEGMDSVPEMNESFSELKVYIQNFIEAKDLDDYMNSTNHIVEIVSMELFANLTVKLPNCHWIRDAIYIQYTTDNVNTIFSSISLKQTALLEYISSLTQILNTIQQNYNDDMVNIMERVTKYLDGNITKKELSEYIGSPWITVVASDMVMWNNDAYNSIKDVKAGVTSLLDEVGRLYSTLFEWRVPVLKLPKVYQLKVFSGLSHTNRTDINQILSLVPTDLTQTLQSLVTVVKTDYLDVFGNLGDATQGRLRKQVDYLSTLRSDLAEYAASNVINAGFFMENFLQLDIFYKDMSYEEISQQPAFSLPSLLGEVGGFMGLLLGASIMTLCELLDYIVINAIRVCWRKKKKKKKKKNRAIQDNINRAPPGWRT